MAWETALEVSRRSPARARPASTQSERRIVAEIVVRVGYEARLEPCERLTAGHHRPQIEVAVGDVYGRIPIRLECGDRVACLAGEQVDGNGIAREGVQARTSKCSGASRSRERRASPMAISTRTGSAQERKLGFGDGAHLRLISLER